MSGYTTYKNAPIAEALLDIRCVLPDAITVEVIEGIHEQVRARFPEKAKRLSIQATFKLPAAPPPEPVLPEAALAGAGTKTDGLMFRSSENGKIFQARLDGFTFNKLKPYEDWATFSTEARELWEIYAENLKPTLITRTALRYINKVLIPLPVADFKEYFLTVPDIAPGLPQSVAGFFLQLSLPFPQHNATANIIETIEPFEGTKFPLIFDVDAFSDRNFLPNDPEIWSTFETLRQIKNDVFLKTFTEKAKELFV